MKYPAFVLALLAACLLMSCNETPKTNRTVYNFNSRLAALTGICWRVRNAGKYDSLIIVGKKGLHEALKTQRVKEISLFNYFIGIGYQGREQRDSAIFYLKTAESIAYRLKYIENMVNAQVQLSSLYYDYGLPDSLNVYKNKMTAEADTIKQVALKMKLVSRLGFIYAKTDQPQKALKKYLEVLAYAESHKDSITAGARLQDISQVYARLSEFEKAVDYSIQAIPYLKRSPLDEMINYNDLGTHYVDLKKYYNAIDAFQKSIDIATRFNDTAYREATYVSIASPFIELGSFETATTYLNKALGYYNTSKYELGFMYTMMMFGKMENKKGNTGKSIGYFERALTAAKKTGHLDSETYIYGVLADISGKSKAYEKAYQYQLAYNKLSDSLTKTTTKKDIADLEIKYQTNQKEQKITLLNQQTRLKDIDLSSQQRKWWFLVAFVGFLLVTAFLLYRSYGQKRDSNRLLEEKNRTLNALNDKLNEANATKTKLFSILSHDLRAPVSNLFSFLTIQKKYANKLSPQQQAEHNDRIRHSAENLMDSMEDLLIWSKSQMDSFSLNPVQINAAEVIDYVISMHGDFAAERQLILERDGEMGALLFTDVNFLKIVLRNVVSNAIKFTPAGGRIKIFAQRLDGSLQFSISDTGPGMNKEQISNLFEWNSIRSDSSGLGLKLAKEFITRLGGAITVESAESIGTTFIISVPVLQPVVIETIPV